MTTLTATKTNALKAYREAPEDGKTMLKNLFGPEHFGKVTDRIKTFEDACAETGIVFNPPAGLSADELAYMKLKIIAKALNEGWQPDWTDSSQTKYYPWFENYNAASGFSCNVYDFGDSFTSVGSRLCFKSSELAKYAGTQFLTIYNQFLA